MGERCMFYIKCFGFEPWKTFKLIDIDPGFK